MDNRYEFTTYDDAWRFMLLCDERGHLAGFPDGRLPYVVTVEGGLAGGRLAEDDG